MDDIPDAVRDDLESRPNVIGTGRGRKRVDDRPTDQEAVVVLVSRKYPDAELADDDRVPETVEIDGEDVPTDVQEVGDVRTQAAPEPPEERRPNRKREWRPAPGGVSAGHPEISAGTLGTPPLRTEAGETTTLTNRHVAAPVGEADRGDAFLQPGPADGGTAEDDIGDLLEWSEIREDGPNRSDSALVTVDPAVVDDTVLGVGALVDWGEVDPDATYTKSGRTTGVTTGDLRARDTRIKVDGYYSEGPSVFVGVDVFGPMSAGGDSGSVIGRDRDDGFYGTHLLFAGSDRSTIGIPMETVQEIHGELTPLPGDEGGGDGGEGEGPGDGSDGGTSDFLSRVETHLRETFGDAVAPGDAAEFRVDAWPVTLAVFVVASADEAVDAVGPALAAVADGTHPVIVYPGGDAAGTVDQVSDAVTLAPLPP